MNIVREKLRQNEEQRIMNENKVISFVFNAESIKSNVTSFTLSGV